MAGEVEMEKETVELRRNVFRPYLAPRPKLELFPG